MRTCPEHPEASVYAALRTMVVWQCSGGAPGCGVLTRLEGDPPTAACPHCKTELLPSRPQRFEDLKCSACHNRVSVAPVPS